MEKERQFYPFPPPKTYGKRRGPKMEVLGGSDVFLFKTGWIFQVQTVGFGGSILGWYWSFASQNIEFWGRVCFQHPQVSIYLFIYLSTYLSTYHYLSLPFITFQLPIYLSIYLPIYLSTYLPTYLPIYLSDSRFYHLMHFPSTLLWLDFQPFRRAPSNLLEALESL